MLNFYLSWQWHITKCFILFKIEVTMIESSNLTYYISFYRLWKMKLNLNVPSLDISWCLFTEQLMNWRTLVEIGHAKIQNIIDVSLVNMFQWLTRFWQGYFKNLQMLQRPFYFTGIQSDAHFGTVLCYTYILWPNIEHFIPVI